jgi:ABC-type methionine transport system ATPase subunit
MKFILEIEADTPNELLDKLRKFCSQRGIMIDGDAVEEATVTETTPKPEPKAAKKANGKAKPKEEKIECSDKPLTEAQVRSAMIDYVNAASEKSEKTRKEIFKELLDNFTVDKLADLPADKYDAMVQLVADEKAKL